jgi:tRNA 5-methylaminomethyl-2-thiouridine biosynthesis bifunctional protein
VRGQASFAPGIGIACPVAWGGYAAPARKGVLFGATHDRGETATELRAANDRRNLASLAKVLPALAERLEAIPIEGRAAVRAVTPDRLPIAGRLDEGLYVLGGLGSRGFATAPLLAEHLAAIVLGAPSPLPQGLTALVDFDRFAPA